MRGSATSSANFVAPTTLAVASTFRSAFPTTRKAAVRRSGGRSAAVFLRVAIQRLPRRLGLLPAHAGRRQFHRLVDLDVSGAAAQVACQRLLDLVARRPPVLGEQRPGGEQERWGAVAALRRAQLGERVLQAMQPAALRHPLDRLHPAPGAREAEHQAGEHRTRIHEHRAGAALAQLAAVLRAGEAQVLAQHFEQRLVRCERDLDGLAVELQRDLRLGVEGRHDWKRNLVAIRTQKNEAPRAHTGALSRPAIRPAWLTSGRHRPRPKAVTESPIEKTRSFCKAEVYVPKTTPRGYTEGTFSVPENE